MLYIKITDCIYVYMQTSRQHNKIENSSTFKKGNIGMANMQRRQDRDGLVMMAR